MAHTHKPGLVSERDVPSRAIAAKIAVAAVGFAVLVTACTGDGTSEPSPSPTAAPGDTAQATAQEFLQAVADGRRGDAVSLSTVTAADFACPALTADQQGRSEVAQVEPLSADPAGTSATVTVDPQAQSNQITSLDLVGGAGQWEVEWPASYAIEAVFTETAVAELRLSGTAVGDDDCVVRAQDGLMTLAAFPDRYIATVVDPTGVVDYLFLSENLWVKGDAPAVWDLGEPVAGNRLEQLQNETLFAHVAQRVTCNGSLCEPDVLDHDAELSLTKVWSDDGETWSATVEQGGSAYTATLSRDDADELLLDLQVG